MLDTNDKNIQMGIKVSVVAIGLLAVFLLSKTIGEIIKWNTNDVFPAKTITVTADGEAIATSDIASFSFTINESADTSEDAQKNAEDKTDNALKYLKDNGVEDKDIKTEYYNINPKYESVAPCYAFDCPAPKNKIVGYEVSEAIRVKVRDTDNAGKFLGELTKFGINNVSGLTFTIDDEDVLYTQARTDAITKAQDKARVLAKDLHVRLGDVISFSEDNQGNYPGPMYDGGMGVSAMKAESSAVSLPKGENKYTTKVYVTYELK